MRRENPLSRGRQSSSSKRGEIDDSIHDPRERRSRSIEFSPACAALAGTVVEGLASTAGLSCIFLSFTHPLTCVPWLRPRYGFHRYYGRSDSWQDGSSTPCSRDV